jgi:hypothetical protein
MTSIADGVDEPGVSTAMSRSFLLRRFLRGCGWLLEIAGFSPGVDRDGQPHFGGVRQPWNHLRDQSLEPVFF